LKSKCTRYVQARMPRKMGKASGQADDDKKLPRDLQKRENRVSAGRLYE